MLSLEPLIGLLAIAGLVLLDFAALRWGVDTRTPNDPRQPTRRDI